MNDEIKDVILQTLARIEGKLDAHGMDISSIGQRLAVLEAKQETQDKINNQVAELQNLKNQGLGVKQIVGWLISVAIAIGAYFK